MSGLNIHTVDWTIELGSFVDLSRWSSVSSAFQFCHPLMILAAACFAKSSQRFYDWIIQNKLFGHHVKNYREGKGILSSFGTMWTFVYLF